MKNTFPGSYIMTTYNKEIEQLPIITDIKYTIDSNNDKLYINELKYKILPTLKFIRGRDYKIHISSKKLEEIDITIPFTIKKQLIIRDCTKFHQDTIEYEVEHKIYDSYLLSNFIKSKLLKYSGITI